MAMAGSDKNTTIRANIDEIQRATYRLASSSKEAAAEARRLAQEYQHGLNGVTNTQAVEQYEIAIKAVQKNIDNYEQSIQKLTAEREALNDIDGKDSKIYDVLTKRITSYTNALARERDTLIALAKEKEQYTDASISAAKAEEEERKQAEKSEQTNKKLTIAQSGLNKAWKIGVGILTALIVAYKRMISASIEEGQELYSLSKRYNTNVVELQKRNKGLYLATQQNDLFTNSLSVLAKGMADIAGNGGQKYATSLRAIGLTYQQLNQLSREDQFDAIVNGLMALTNESERAAHAQTLLGESGQYIVGALADGTLTLQDYLVEAEKYSYLTEEIANKLAELAPELDEFNSKIKLTEAELTIEAAPIIEQVLGILTYGVMPILKGLTQNSYLLYVAIGTLLTLKVTSTILGWVAAIRTADASMKAATITAVTLKATLLGLGIALGTAVLTMGITGMQAKQMREEMEKTAAEAEKLSQQSGTFVTGVENTTTSKTERTVRFELDVNSHGDTPIARENAREVAQLTAEELQKRWGRLAG